MTQLVKRWTLYLSSGRDLRVMSSSSTLGSALGCGAYLLEKKFFLIFLNLGLSQKILEVGPFQGAGFEAWAQSPPSPQKLLPAQHLCLPQGTPVLHQFSSFNVSVGMTHSIGEFAVPLHRAWGRGVLLAGFLHHLKP